MRFLSGLTGEALTNGVVDPTGNRTTAPMIEAFLRGFLDTIPPLVTITVPPNLSLFSTSPITVSGSVDDDRATVTVNGVSAVVTDGNFTASDVPLVEGSNTLTATGTDPAGNAGTASIQVTLDTILPVLAITAPDDGSRSRTARGRWYC